MRYSLIYLIYIPTLFLISLGIWRFLWSRPLGAMRGTVPEAARWTAFFLLLAGQAAIAPLSRLTGSGFAAGENWFHTALAMLGMTGVIIACMQLIRGVLWLIAEGIPDLLLECYDDAERGLINSVWEKIGELPERVGKNLWAKFKAFLPDREQMVREQFGRHKNPLWWLLILVPLSVWSVLSLAWALFFLLGPGIVFLLFGVLTKLFVFYIPTFALLMLRRGATVIRRMLRSPLVTACMLLFGLGAGCFGVWSAVKVPEVHTVELAIAGLPGSLEGYRLVQLTDLHLGTLWRDKWMRAVVDRTNALDADLVVFTGDFGDGKPEKIVSSLTPLRDIRAKDGIFSCLGNHEGYEGKAEWIDFYRKNGYRLLLNEWAAVEGKPLFIAGADDRRNGGALAGYAEELRRAMPQDHFKLVLDHQPGGAQKNADLGFDLQLSGHTHGGMMFFTQKAAAAANNGFVSGRYDVGGMTLYVSNGTALWSHVPFRLFVPSEITLFILKKG
ncbi:MAG: metallophosphoesterase [Mailhella sp.]|nr:metallophosphoesterase [Mailhella sp.]